ncbi:MAG: hypothetical protein ACWGQW_18690 [bacterium]
MEDSKAKGEFVVVAAHMLTALAGIHQQLERMFDALGIDPSELNVQMDSGRDDQTDPPVATGKSADGFYPYGSDD